MKKLIIILAVFSASFSAVFSRLANAPQIVIVIYRMLISVLILSVWVLLKYRDELRRISRRQLYLCMLAGVFLGLHFVSYFEGLALTSIASATVLVDSEVFFVAIGGMLLFGERNSFAAWTGILLAFAGCVVVVSGDAGGGSLRGDLLALAGALFTACYTMIGSRVRKGISTNVYTWIVYCFAGITAAVMAIIKRVPVFGYAPVNLACGLGLAVMGTLLGHSVFSWGLRYEKAAFISIAKLLEPVFAVILGIFFFREMPGLRSLAGGLMVIAGILLFTACSEKQKQGS